MSLARPFRRLKCPCGLNAIGSPTSGRYAAYLEYDRPSRRAGIIDSVACSLAARRVYSSHAPREAYLERSKDDRGLVYLTLDRPSAKNALSVKLLREMAEALDEIRFDKEARALILRSSTMGAFCAGADLKERKSMTQTEVARFLHDLRQTFSGLEDLPLPTIAAIDGPALGGGLELALSCDLRVAGNEADKIGLTEVRLGIIPGAGGTQRLARLLGPAKAKDLIFTARILTAQAALEVGLVDYVSANGESASDRATKLAREILPHAPLAVRAAKNAIDTGAQLDLESGLDFERACYATILTTQDRLEGLRAFAEKRKPVFRGE